MGIEVQNTSEQAKLSAALKLLTIEDPSLQVKETDHATLLSGLGELHMEIILDRLEREFGIMVVTGPPSVQYKETISQTMDTCALVPFDKMLGPTRMQVSIHLMLEPLTCLSHITPLTDPIVAIEPQARAFLQISEDASDESLYYANDLAKELINGCRGAL